MYVCHVKVAKLNPSFFIKMYGQAPAKFVNAVR